MNRMMTSKRIASLILVTIFTFVSVFAAFSAPTYAASKKPSRVTGVKVTATSGTSLKITWKKTKNAKKYQIYRAAKKSGKYKLIKTTTKTKYVNTKLKTGKKYYYKVRAINGKKKGKFSAIKSGTTKKTTPEDNTEPFTGDLIITAEQAVAKVGDANVIFVDCTGSNNVTVKGAVAVSWQSIATCSDEYGAAGDDTWGRIPEPSELAKRLGNFGLDKSKEIITLGHTLKGWGEDARVAWELRAAGYTNVKIVDGGVDAVIAAGAPTDYPAEPVPCTVEIDTIDKTHVAETEDLMSGSVDYKFADVRTADEYNGATKYGEKKGGHIKGAVLVPYLDFFKSNGKLKSNKEITEMFEAAGFNKTDYIVAYCTGGIRSAYAQMILEMCGFENTFNYDQSYWNWCVNGEVE